MMEKDLKHLTYELAVQICNKINAKKTLYVGFPVQEYSDKVRAMELQHETGISRDYLLFKMKESIGYFPGLFDDFINQSTKSIDFLSINEIDKQSDKYDFLVADLPIGLKNELWNNKHRIKGNWAHILNLLSLVSENGYGLFWIEKSFWFGLGLKFREILEDNNFHLNAVINPPEKILEPYTSLQPNILLFSRQQVDKLFIAEIVEGSNIEKITNNLINQIDGSNLTNGLLINIGEFYGFDKYKISKEIDTLKIHYKNYDEYILKDVAIDIIAGRNNQKLSEKENSIYIPKLGTSPVISNLKEGKLKHQNYYQVVLDKKVVLNEYAASFFNSGLGKVICDSMRSGGVIANVNKSDLIQASIPIPSLSEQRLIIKTNNKLTKLSEKIYDFKLELSLNPSSVSDIQETLDSLLDALDELSSSDKVLSIIRSGETKKVEFKSTFRYNLRAKKIDSAMTYEIMRAINAMLNTLGGTLLIGVEDDGNILGVDSDNFKNEDKYKLAFFQAVENYMSKTVASKIRTKFINIDDKKILFIEIPKLFPQKTIMNYKVEGKPIEKIFIRVGPKSRELLISEVDNHFKNKDS